MARLLMRGLILVGALVAGALLFGCGESNTTTVISTSAESAPEPQTTTVIQKVEKKESTAAEEAPAEEPSTESTGEPPDVVGLSLPEAEKQLKAAGFNPDPDNTDTLLGIVVKSNYTICKQYPPKGNVVPLLAQKYGC